MRSYFSLSDRQIFFTNLSFMLASGISLLEAFESLQSEVKQRQKHALVQISAELSEGKTLAESLAQFPKDFDRTTLQVIRTSEEAGTLEQTLSDIADSLERQMAFEEKVKAALTYPSFVLIVCLGVVLMMFLFVIPRVATVFERLRVPLPQITQLLVSISAVMTQYPIQIAVFAACLILSLVGLWHFQREMFLNVFESLPFTRGVACKMNLARFTRSTSLLLKAGVPITETLSYTSAQLTQLQLIKAVDILEKKVISGHTFYEGIRESPRVFGSMMLRLVEAGERSGQLDTALHKSSVFFEKEVSKDLARVTILLEPLLIVGIGFVVGGIMMAIISPIYSLIGQIG